MDTCTDNKDIVDQAVISFYASDNTKDLQQSVEDVLLRMGFNYFAYTYIRPPDDDAGPVTLTNFPKAWEDRYVGNAYFGDDPVLQVSLKSIVPVEWANALAGRELTARQQLVMTEAAEYGLRNGITVPIHQAGSGSAFFNAASELEGEDYAVCLANHRHDIHVLAHYFHDAILRHIRTSAEFIRPVNLTPRELECLQWCGRGKTSGEIGLILHLSERTVNFHLSNAMGKLGVRTRAQAVAKLYPMEGMEG